MPDGGPTLGTSILVDASTIESNGTHSSSSARHVGAGSVHGYFPRAGGYSPSTGWKRDDRPCVQTCKIATAPSKIAHQERCPRTKWNHTKWWENLFPSQSSSQCSVTRGIPANAPSSDAITFLKVCDQRFPRTNQGRPLTRTPPRSSNDVKHSWQFCATTWCARTPSSEYYHEKS